MAGPGTTCPSSGDYSGTGGGALAVYRPTTAQWFVHDSGTGGTTVFSFGQAGVDVPVPGDYDGVGRTELAVYRPTTAQWFIHNPITGTNADPLLRPGRRRPADPGGLQWRRQARHRRLPPHDGAVVRSQRSHRARPRLPLSARSGVDRPVPADYTGDGKADIAIYRPTTSQWFVRSSSTDQTQVTSFGQADGDIPVPLDYEGVGKVDLAVYRPSTSQYLIQSSTSGTEVFAPSASLSVQVTNQLENMIAGKSPSTSWNLFTPGTMAGTNYSWNPSAWTANVYLTCVSPYNSFSGAYRAGTLITPQDALVANHYQYGVGTVVQFVDQSNVIHTATVASSSEVGTSDFYLVHFSAPLPSTITPCQVLPADYAKDLPLADGSTNLDGPGVATLNNLPVLVLNQYKQAMVGDWDGLQRGPGRWARPTSSPQPSRRERPSSPRMGSSEATRATRTSCSSTGRPC